MTRAPESGRTIECEEHRGLSETEMDVPTFDFHSRDIPTLSVKDGSVQLATAVFVPLASTSKLSGQLLTSGFSKSVHKRKSK